MNIKIEQFNVIKLDSLRVRIFSHIGEPWFIAIDVCRALEINNTSDSLKKLELSEIMTIDLTDSHSGKRGGARKLSAVSESGFYKLIARSRNATKKGTLAYTFSNWVFGEVIPTIRKTGSYGVPWSFLNDFTKREEKYRIESSKRGRNLEECKRLKSNLIAEEKLLWNKYQPQLNLGGSYD